MNRDLIFFLSVTGDGSNPFYIRTIYVAFIALRYVAGAHCLRPYRLPIRELG